jgi:poly-gamma-glutamate synthesis protein (capsule biosynthesis protein)
MLMPDAALGDLQRDLAYETSPTVRLVAVGDVMLGGYCGEQMAEKGLLYSFGDPDLAALLADADIALGNLASPISERGELMAGLTVYRADPMAAQALAEVGFDLMSVANEHVPAFGGEALLDTLDALRETGIEPVGAGVNRDEAYAPVVIERNGLQVALLAFSEVGPDVLAATADAAGVAWLHDSRALRAVAEASRRADLVVVSCHWGDLHALQVTEAQVAAAEALLGAGADLIIGHHSHTVQAISYGEQGVVAYSLGDLVYHPWSSTSSADGVALVATLGGGGVRAVELVPFRVEECRPRLLDGEAADVVLGRASALPTPSGGP